MGARDPGRFEHLGAFVGRYDEVGVLREALVRLQHGDGRVFLLHGEAGSGKSRLLSEIAREAGAAGLELLHGDPGHPGAAVEPIWARVAAHLERTRAASGGPVRLSARPGRAIESTPPATGSREQQPAPQLEVIGRTARELREAASRRPIVLIIDDLQWVSFADARFIELATRSGAPLLALLAGRDDELRTIEHVRDLVARLTEAGRLDRIPLRPFGRDEVEAYLRGVLEQAPHDLVEAVIERTEGNPFFLTEVTGLLLGDLGREPLDETLGRIPEGVRNVLEYRIGQLSADVVEALSIAAVIGLEFNVWLLARVLQREPALLFEQLQTAVGDSVLTEGSGHRRLRFAHSLVRDTLLDLLPPVRTAELHGRVAEVIEEIDAGASDVATLAFHYARSAVVSEQHVPIALRYLRAAARRAEELSYWDRAAALYEQALELIEGTGPPAAERIELMRAAGQCWSFAGMTRPAWRLLMQATEEARFANAISLAADCALLALEWIDAPPERRRRLVVELLQHSDQLSPEQVARLLLRLAGNDTNQHATDAAEQARRLVDEHQLERVALPIADRDYVEALAAGDLAAARTILERRASIAVREDDRVESVRTMYRLAETTARQGQLAAASGLAEATVAMAEREHLLGIAEGARCVLSAIALARGRIGEFDELTADMQRPVANQQRARRLELDGNYEAALRWLSSNPLPGQAHPRIAWDLHGSLARIYTSMGRRADAERELAAWALARAESEHPTDRQDAITVVGGALVEFGDDALVRAVWEESAAWSQLRFIPTTATGVDRVRGQLALRLGDAAAAARHLDRALAWATFEELPAECALVLAAYERLDAQTIDWDVPMIARARQLALRAEGGPPSADLRAVHSLVSAREQQVLELVAQGKTNLAIANDLGISRHTVGRHVSSILAKLDASNRAEAVRRALDYNLLGHGAPEPRRAYPPTLALAPPLRRGA